MELLYFTVYHLPDRDTVYILKIRIIMKYSSFTSQLEYITGYLFSLLLPGILYSASLSWQPVSDSDLAGYLVYMGTESKIYSDSLDVGNVQEYMVPHLEPGVTYYFAIRAYDNWGNQSGFSPEIAFTLEDTTMATDMSDFYNNTHPLDFLLAQNYPNPFNPKTTIEFSVKQPGRVNLTVFNSRGEKVRTLFDNDIYDLRNRIAVVWDGKNQHGSNAASGVYFYRLRHGSRVETKRMILTR